MEFDAFDAILHHIYKQTIADAHTTLQGDTVSTGVCLRIDTGFNHSHVASSYTRSTPHSPRSNSTSGSRIGSRRASTTHLPGTSTIPSPPNPVLPTASTSKPPQSQPGANPRFVGVLSSQLAAAAASAAAASGSSGVVHATTVAAASIPVVPGTSAPTFRTFPYGDPMLEEFEAGVVALNPEVAVKLRSAAVHASLANVAPTQTALIVDASTRIQILDTMAELGEAEKDQGAAFIRDERVLVIWSDIIDNIIPSAHDFESRLLDLVWRQRSMLHPALASPSLPSSPSSSTRGLPHLRHHSRGGSISTGLAFSASRAGESIAPESEPGALLNEKATAPDAAPETKSEAQEKKKGGFFSFKKKAAKSEKEKDLEDGSDPRRDKRPVKLHAPIYDGIATALALVFVGNGVRMLLIEWALDGAFIRFALLATGPLLFAVSLFFAMTIVNSVSFVIGPVTQYHENSKYYSAIKPRADGPLDRHKLPHITIQMPVYKESLEKVIAPSVHSIQRAMVTYARQGGTSSIFICDDGMQLISDELRAARMEFYAKHGVGWVARPKHSDEPGGFKRAGRFKKASNMNYGLNLSLRMEQILLDIENPEKEKANGADGNGGQSYAPSVVGGGAPTDPFASQSEFDFDLEERALRQACEETNGEAWAAGGKALRVGEIILLVDSDTQVPEDCLRDAARELAECPEVAILQHESDVLQVANHYFENAITYFTQRVNHSISMACANGEVAPFVGHNAFLRWQVMQEVATKDPDSGKMLFWSESHVSEDFDMAMRVQRQGYIVRWATYSNGGFKEGVSLTCDDELNRWSKYAYGCNELLFNPLKDWWRKGPIAPQIHNFMWAPVPIHYKLSCLSYMFSYYGIAASTFLSLLNYALLGLTFRVDGFYNRGFEIWLACCVVFLGLGNVGFSVLEYRLNQKNLLESLLENVKWLPFFFFFFGGMGLHVSGAIISHLFSINMSWGATLKEVEASNFFKEIPRILKRFWLTLTISWAIMLGIAINATPLVPDEWRVYGDGWAVILPLAINAGCHILYPVVLNPWLMVFSY